jgi:hypothetical protein
MLTGETVVHQLLSQRQHRLQWIIRDLGAGSHTSGACPLRHERDRSVTIMRSVAKCRERPRGRRAAEQRDEQAPPHGLFPKARDYGNIAGQGPCIAAKKGAP